MNQDINSIIDQLAEIDSASAKIMQEAAREKSKYAEYIQQQKQQFDNALQEQVDREVAAFQESVAAENEKQLSQFRIDCDRDIANLEQMFTDNQDKWADEIFNNIIKG